MPGGLIAETEHWHADHCIGPFGIGAVVLKTKKHIENVWELPPAVAQELGPFAQRISNAIIHGVAAERVYLTMWVDKPPHHVHLVLYPRYPQDPRRGLDLQNGLLSEGAPSNREAARAATSIRSALEASG